MSKEFGEWSVGPHDAYPCMLTIRGPASPITIVTSATDIDFMGYVRRSNEAQLIAASPDLLEALEDLISSCKALDAQGLEQEIKNAEQAIHKATGDLSHE